ncbi:MULTISPECIES: protein translocase subunit SecD [Brevibacillus]|jgi:preprotein translocase subunit SecD/SecD/SecF fusion protein|uniref:Protein translocase subunit SecD n=1 Tax=Brevibacillus aydinogluensis TaxID=927786 RepID=A0AA48M9Y6_9BACL|nr:MULTISPECIES: protein translocase subunit SecD [Bacillales]REK64539.1 MAG: protein translocase subunit SecD [Brevibacillus sp.]MBR8660629.1 protein translocase subunit SecD [Brevibacillus sp. NL20B1]MDT3414410.1 preprotein translocase subunit SecD/SecD/SecF fusion protein [Brevibacillus aydinogluensis]UFJ59997.1 protein translocase subunit SecD [Anoxybacillus sediminis]CAJ1003371.1 Protein translocase subunit SecD [Brevibacillus aydinogluensis]
MIKWGRFLLFLVVVGMLATLITTTTQQVAGNIRLGLDLQGGFEILYVVEPLEPNQQVDMELLKATAGMVEKRVNIGGVTEPVIETELPNRIRVKIASEKANQDELRELIGKPAVLEFRDENGNVLLRGSDLASGGAGVGYDDLKRPVVTLKISDPKKLEDITRANLGKPMAIYLDDNMLTNPVIQNVITGGNAQISGNFTQESAQELADILNSGALPAKLIEKQVTSVGASLGTLALQKTIYAGYVGAALIIVFMLVVYRLPGLIANITLVAFTYFCLVVLDWMDATLTLPGIAGFILSVGMAVDANIITYERIQEEIRSGKTILSAFRAGERRSLITIIDAHVTTLIATAVLFYFGTSSIQGFAIVLAMTLIVSVITNVFGSRFLLWLLVRSNMIKKPFWFGVKESEIGEL